MSGDDALGGVRGEEADAVLRLQRFYVGRTEPHRYLHGDGIIGTSKEQGGGKQQPSETIGFRNRIQIVLMFTPPYHSTPCCLNKLVSSNVCSSPIRSVYSTPFKWSISCSITLAKKLVALISFSFPVIS